MGRGENVGRTVYPLRHAAAQGVRDVKRLRPPTQGRPRARFLLSDSPEEEEREQ